MKTRTHTFNLSSNTRNASVLNCFLRLSLVREGGEMLQPFQQIMTQTRFFLFPRHPNRNSPDFFVPFSVLFELITSPIAVREQVISSHTILVNSVSYSMWISLHRFLKASDCEGFPSFWKPDSLITVSHNLLKFCYHWQYNYFFDILATFFQSVFLRNAKKQTGNVTGYNENRSIFPFGLG